GKPVVLDLPKELMDILRDHIAMLKGKMKESELLFPSRTGGIRSRSALDKPFGAIAKKMKLSFNLTPRAMRRSFQDLAREAQIEALVTRSISGHATEEMRELYSTVRTKERLAAVEKIMRVVK